MTTDLCTDGVTGFRFERRRPLRVMVQTQTRHGPSERCVAEITADELARATSEREVWEMVVRRVRINVPGPGADLIIARLLVKGLHDGRQYDG